MESIFIKLWIAISAISIQLMTTRFGQQHQHHNVDVITTAPISESCLFLSYYIFVMIRFKIVLLSFYTSKDKQPFKQFSIY